MTISNLFLTISDLLIPTMLVMFAAGMVMRTLIYFLVKREEWFTKEFEKRVDNFMTYGPHDEKASFYQVTKRLLEKTYYELFVKRAVLKRRRPDRVMSLTDRLFMVQHGMAWIVKDSLKRLRILEKNGQNPDFLRISKRVFEHNPCFSKVFGFLSVALFTDILSILPGIFIVSGILGTFLGIMGALPELSSMDITDVAASKAVMDGFLAQVSFAMRTSIFGIVLSVLMTVTNTFMSPQKIFFTTVNRFEEALLHLWQKCKHNMHEEWATEFDEHKDPLEVVEAERAVLDELAKRVAREAPSELPIYH